MIARTLSLIAAAGAFFLAAGLPARFVGGDDALVQCAAATLLALVPGVLTLLWAGASVEGNPATASLVALGAGGVRMFAVLGVAVLLYFQGPYFRGQDGFLLWVAVAYLFLLAVEITLVVRAARPAAAPMSQPEAQPPLG